MLRTPVAWFFLGASLLTLYRIGIIQHLGLDLFVDEAYYWDWSQALAWGYYSKPPGIAVLIAFTTALGGHTELAVRAGSLLLHPLTAGVLFLLTRHWYSATTASAVGIAYLCLPAVAFSSLFISTDVLLLFFWSLALYALARFMEQPQTYWPLLGLALGLGMLSKYSMVLFGPCLLLFLWLHPPARSWLRQPYLYAAALLAGLIFAPNLLWNAQHAYPTLHHTAEIARLAQPGLHWDEGLEFVLYQFVLLGPGLFILWLLALRRKPSDPRSLLLAIFSLLPVLLLTVQALRGGAHANWAVFAYPAALILLASHTPTRYFWWAVGFNAVLMLGFYHHQTLVQGYSTLTASPIRQDAFKRLRGWAELGTAVTGWQQHYPHTALLAEERDLLAQLRYYVHPTPTVWSWNPQQQVRHHYDLTRSLTLPPPRGEYLFITRRREVNDLQAVFQQVQYLAPIEIAASPSRQLSIHVFRLQAF